ncbi:hypothetical protein BH20BAC1_BH20BAC1_16990 [soil metagenome]
MLPGKNAGEPVDMVIDVPADELALDLPFDENLTVLDVRNPVEFAEGHVKGAMNLSLSDMSDITVIAQIEETQNHYMHSLSGYRSVIAVSILKREGYHNLIKKRGRRLVKNYARTYHPDGERSPGIKLVFHSSEPLYNSLSWQNLLFTTFFLTSKLQNDILYDITFFRVISIVM